MTGLVGARARWRTMPWLVFLFGLMIAPLGVVSIFFIIIQPIVIGTWAMLTLIAAAAMLIQNPYSLDELLATLQFVRRRARKGRPWLRVFLFGDTDEGISKGSSDEFDRGAGVVLRDMWAGGVNLPWNLALAGLLAAILPFSRLTVDAEGMMAHADHLLGLLALTVISLSAAEVARALRFLLVPLGIAIAVAPWLFDGNVMHCLVNGLVGLSLAILSGPRGAIVEHYGTWDRRIF